ncbi:hypothetical protein ACH5RR_001303 [Cinchona calisaya]|uniref:Reverse transcriptase domain-containing protein n=1 Tax=Cinchona calisaya TaxID=153742 RepID=A0ABD3B307_9GENT
MSRFFQSSCGVKQGDPLFSFLFVLSSEFLSRCLKAMVDSDSVLPFSLSRGCPTVSHVAFADDCIIFTQGDKNSLKWLLHFLELYQKGSGKKINFAKSSLFFPRKSSRGHIASIESLTGMCKFSILMTYLGCLIFIRIKSNTIFEPLVTKVRNVLNIRIRNSFPLEASLS